MKKILQPQQNTSKLLWVFMFLFVLIAYYPALKNQWTKWDDIQYTIDNPVTQKLSLQNIKTVFSSSYQGNYVPLTYLSFALDRTLLGDSPKGFISVNILIHLINTLLVYILMGRFIANKLACFMGALLFGVHPMHVESVAWIAERKDVLYACFFFLSILLYISYINTRKLSNLIISCALMVLSILSKNVAIVLPFVFFALDYLFKRDFKNKKILLEKLPFLIIAIVFMYVGTATVQNNAEALSSYNLSFVERIIMASYSYVHYIIKLTIPINLSAYYPYPFLPEENIPSYLWLYLPAAILITCSILWWGRKNSLIIFSILFFIINIIPALQFFPVGDAVYADRFIYVASLGFFIPFSIFVKYILKEPKYMYIKYTGMLLIAITFLVLCIQRVAVWKNTKTLWTDVLMKNDNISLAHTNLGNAFMEESQVDSAIVHYKKALKINPSNKTALNNKASVYFQQKKYQDAINDYKKIISFNAMNPDAYAAIGICYYYENKFDSALQYYNQYFMLDSNNAGIYINSALTKHQLKNYAAALKDYDKAISIYPEYADAYAKRGILKFEMLDTTGACKDWYEASRLGMADVNSIIKTYCK